MPNSKPLPFLYCAKCGAPFPEPTRNYVCERCVVRK